METGCFGMRAVKPSSAGETATHSGGTVEGVCAGGTCALDVCGACAEVAGAQSEAASSASVRRVRVFDIVVAPEGTARSEVTLPEHADVVRFVAGDDVGERAHRDFVVARGAAARARRARWRARGRRRGARRR